MKDLRDIEVVVAAFDRDVLAAAARALRTVRRCRGPSATTQAQGLAMKEASEVSVRARMEAFYGSQARSAAGVPWSRSGWSTACRSTSTRRGAAQPERRDAPGGRGRDPGRAGGGFASLTPRGTSPTTRSRAIADASVKAAEHYKHGRRAQAAYWTEVGLRLVDAAQPNPYIHGGRRARWARDSVGIA